MAYDSSGVGPVVQILVIVPPEAVVIPLGVHGSHCVSHLGCLVHGGSHGRGTVTLVAQVGPPLVELLRHIVLHEGTLEATLGLGEGLAAEDVALAVVGTDVDHGVGLAQHANAALASVRGVVHAGLHQLAQNFVERVLLVGRGGLPLAHSVAQKDLLAVYVRI